MIRTGRKEIVTDGLVLYLDPVNRKSYSLSSTTWNDLSTNVATGTFSSFDINNNYDSTDGGGCILFDGIDDRLLVHTFIRPPGNTFAVDSYNFDDEVTLEAFVKPSSLLTDPNIIAKGSNYGYRYRFTSDGRIWLYSQNTTTINTISSSPIINLNEWVHAVAVFSQSGLKAYVNGVLVASNVQPFSPDTTLAVGCVLSIGTFCLSECFAGKIGIVRVYHKELTSDEILKNFNADRGRYQI
jgi:hypothetical protein